MITSILLKIVYGGIWVLVSPILAFSDVTLDNNIVTSIVSIKNGLASINSFVPVSTILQIFGLILGIEAVVALYKVLMWVLKKIPGVN